MTLIIFIGLGRKYMANLGINSISSVASSVTGAIAGVVPGMTVRSNRANKAISWIGKKISSPQNRLILGVSALMSQPFIDLNNKKIDEDTRKVSAARTVAKIIAGTLTGVLIRAGCIKAIDLCCMLPNKINASTKFKSLRTLFTPEAAMTGVLKDLNHYKKALGTILSLAVMVVTNFLIDAPLTKYLTNKFVDKIHSKNPPKSSENPAKVNNKGVKHE